MKSLHPDTLNFLKTLSQNNTRNFFGVVKPLYEEIRNQIIEYTKELISGISKFDETIPETLDPKQCLFRIYRDARRLKEGDPVYKTNFGMVIAPGGKNDENHVGYYLHLQPGGSMFAGGVYRPTSENLINLRHYIARYGDKYLKLVNDPAFKEQFGKVQGETLKRPPAGFANHPHLDLIMKKQHLIYHKYTDKEVIDSGFSKKFLEDCKLAMDWFHFLDAGYVYTTRKHEL